METRDLPGYQVWMTGGNRDEVQRANREAGRACYCASIWGGWCDACTGLAPIGSERWERLLQDAN